MLELLKTPGLYGLYKRLKAEGTILLFDTGWEAGLSIENYKEYLELANAI